MGEDRKLKKGFYEIGAVSTSGPQQLFKTRLFTIRIFLKDPFDYDERLTRRFVFFVKKAKFN